MNKRILKKSLIISIMLLFMGMSVVPSTATVVEKKSTMLTFYDGNTLYVGGDGPGNYTRIQDAIDNSSDGDTVFVYNGIYYEFVLVNKQITLRGEDKHNTIIEGSGTPYIAVIHVYPGDTLKNVTISDFTIRNTPKHSGISLNPDNNIVSNCIFYNLHAGIDIYSDNNIIFNCQCYNTFVGISITGDNNEISYCRCYSNEYAGTSINNGNNNKISNCNIYSNIGKGIYMDYANSNTISKCNISKNEYGIWIAASGNNIINDCTILENVHHGVRIYNGYDNKVYHNNFINNGHGIDLFHSSNNIISDNIISSSISIGINILLSSNNNNITGNKISNCFFGIILFFSSKNIIEKNNFIGNKRHAIFSDLWRNILIENCWDSNYWDKWIGFGPKLIFGRIGLFGLIPWVNFDWYPAREPYDIHMGVR